MLHFGQIGGGEFLGMGSPFHQGGSSTLSVTDNSQKRETVITHPALFNGPIASPFRAIDTVLRHSAISSWIGAITFDPQIRIAAGGFSPERSTLFGIESSAATSDLIFADIRCLLLGAFETCPPGMRMSVHLDRKSPWSGQTDAPDPSRTLTSCLDRPRRLARNFRPPSAGPLRCAGSAAPAGQWWPAAAGGGRRREGWADMAPSPPSAPPGTCRPAARTRTARRH